MASQSQRAATFTVGQHWPPSGSGSIRHVKNMNDLTYGMSQTRLLFNEAVPASTLNRATRVHRPAPIVIEKLRPLAEERERAESSRSSIRFTALSEDRLYAAVNLAKRDLRQGRLESLTNPPVKPSEEVSLPGTSDAKLTSTPSKTKPKTSSSKEKATRAAVKFTVRTAQKAPVSSMPRCGQSPPTRDPGLRQTDGGKQSPLGQEIHKLQKELEVYVQKVEELAKTGGKKEEPLDPDEQNKLDVRWQKQAARSASVIYVLKQQVKEIQEDVEKLRSQNMWDSGKETAVNRLAAAHRGTLRALQAATQQLAHGKVPPLCRELGQLIRQLCLCSAKVEEGSSEAALDILRKLEDLDSALSKQERLEKTQAPARKSHRSKSPIAPKGPSASAGPRKPANPYGAVRGRSRAPQRPRAARHPLKSRGEVLRAGLECLIQRELQANTKADIHPQPVPWTPPSPRSPPPQRSPPRRPEPPVALSSEKRRRAQDEALRRAWLDKMTTQRLKELNHLSKEEARGVQTSRSEVLSPTEWAERAEQKARERIQPLLDEARRIGESRNRTGPSLCEQAAERTAQSGEQLSEELLDDLLDDGVRAAETDRRVEEPTVGSMLLRLEEMHRDQEEVRRRFASVAYSNPLYRDRPGATGPQCHAPGGGPTSPQPIRLTKPVPRQNSAADVILEEPAETGVLSENSPAEEASQDEQQLGRDTTAPGPAESSGWPLFSVPSSTLRSIRQYRQEFARTCEAAGRVDPWAVAERVADDLLTEAISDVAAEVQDVAEEYAEAVFASEFLRPTPPPPAAAAISQ